jgi:hypothetical protein
MNIHVGLPPHNAYDRHVRALATNVACSRSGISAPCIGYSSSCRRGSSERRAASRPRRPRWPRPRPRRPRRSRCRLRQARREPAAAGRRRAGGVVRVGFAPLGLCGRYCRIAFRERETGGQNEAGRQTEEPAFSHVSFLRPRMLSVSALKSAPSRLRRRFFRSRCMVHAYTQMGGA